MTISELEELIKQINLNSLSDEDLERFHNLMLMKSTESRCIISKRIHCRIHFAPQKKD